MSREKRKDSIKTDVIINEAKYKCPCCGEECSELFEGEFDMTCIGCYYVCMCGREMEIPGRVSCEKCEQYE